MWLLHAVQQDPRKAAAQQPCRRNSSETAGGRDRRAPALEGAARGREQPCLTARTHAGPVLRPPCATSGPPARLYWRRSPFDALIVASARNARLPLVTRDHQIGKAG